MQLFIKGGRLLIIGFMCICFINKTHAQVLNTDKTSTLDSTKKFQSSISLAIATDQQKKSLVDLFYAGDFTLIRKNNATTLYTKIDRVTNGGVSIQDVGTFQLKNNHRIGKQLYVESFLQYQWDGGLGLDQRALVGMNLVHQFKNTETEDFFMGAGIFMENEIWNFSQVNDQSLINNTPINITHPKFNLTAKYSVVNPTTNYEVIIRAFNQSGWYKNIFSNRTSLFTTLQFPISKHLSTSFNIDCIYDTAPIVPIDHFHYNYAQALTYSF
jgi:hypothetical protein